MVFVTTTITSSVLGAYVKSPRYSVWRDQYGCAMTTLSSTGATSMFNRHPNRVEVGDPTRECLGVQVDPPFLVATMTSIPEEVVPTAQSPLEHDTPLSFNTSGYWTWEPQVWAAVAPSAPTVSIPRPIAPSTGRRRLPERYSAKPWSQLPPARCTQSDTAPPLPIAWELALGSAGVRSWALGGSNPEP